MKGELGKGLGSYYRGRNLAGQEGKDRQAWKGRGKLLKDRNLVGKEGTGQAGLERKGEATKGQEPSWKGRYRTGRLGKEKKGGDYYRDRRQAYGQRSHDRVDLIERIRT